MAWLAKRVGANDYKPIDEQRKRMTKMADRSENSDRVSSEKRGVSHLFQVYLHYHISWTVCESVVIETYPVQVNLLC